MQLTGTRIKENREFEIREAQRDATKKKYHLREKNSHYADWRFGEIRVS